MPKPKPARLEIQLKPETLKRLQDVAKMQEVSVSAFVRSAILRAITAVKQHHEAGL